MVNYLHKARNIVLITCHLFNSQAAALIASHSINSSKSRITAFIDPDYILNHLKTPCITALQYLLASTQGVAIAVE